MEYLSLSWGFEMFRKIDKTSGQKKARKKILARGSAKKKFFRVFCALKPGLCR
jgi:hypothetical protein